MLGKTIRSLCWHLESPLRGWLPTQRQRRSFHTLWGFLPLAGHGTWVAVKGPVFPGPQGCPGLAVREALACLASKGKFGLSELSHGCTFPGVHLWEWSIKPLKKHTRTHTNCIPFTSEQCCVYNLTKANVGRERNKSCFIFHTVLLLPTLSSSSFPFAFLFSLPSRPPPHPPACPLLSSYPFFPLSIDFTPPALASSSSPLKVNLSFHVGWDSGGATGRRHTCHSAGRRGPARVRDATRFGWLFFPRMF